MSDDHGHDVESWVKKYKMVFWALMVLTVVTVAVSFLEVSIAMGVVIALIIASFKGGLVAGIFMHLVEEKPIIVWILILTFVLFIPLIFLPVYWAADSVTL